MASLDPVERIQRAQFARSLRERFWRPPGPEVDAREAQRRSSSGIPTVIASREHDVHSTKMTSELVTSPAPEDFHRRERVNVSTTIILYPGRVGAQSSGG